MTKYIVAAAALGVPTGKEDRLTRLPQVIRFTRGQVVDTEDPRLDSDDSRAKIQRLLNAGALRDPGDIPPQAQAEFKSEFDIPLDTDPGGQPKVETGIVKLPGDDVDDEGTDGTPDPASPDTLLHPTPTQQVAPSLVDGTPEARLQGQAVTADNTNDGTNEELRDEDGDGLPEPPSRGASTAVWQQFAQRVKLDVPADANRQTIQDAWDAKAKD